MIGAAAILGAAACLPLPSASAARRLAPYLKAPAHVVPGHSVAVVENNMPAQDLTWVRIQPLRCRSRHGCIPVFARITAKRRVQLGVALLFRWPPGYEECTGQPEGSGAFCDVRPHTWTKNERASLFVGSYVFAASACTIVTVTPGIGSPRETLPAGGAFASWERPFRC